MVICRCIGSIDGKRFPVRFVGPNRIAMTNYYYGPCFAILAISDIKRRPRWMCDVWCVACT